MMTPNPDYAALAQQESPDAVMIITRTGQVLHWDDGAEALFGFSPNEAIGRSIFELIVPEDRAAEESAILAETLAEGFGTLESLRCRKDGALLYACISSKINRDPASGEPLILSTKKDVTQLRVRRDSQRVESKFRELLESVPDAIIIVNPSGHVVYVNARAQDLFGQSAADLLGEPVEQLLPERYRAAHLGHRIGYFAEPHARSMGVGLELYGLRRDGSEFPVEISLSPLPIEDTTMAMSAIRDVSARKQIEQELRDKNLALEAASRAKDRFLASMSHELRTPLNSIIGFTGTLLMQMPGPLNESQEKQLRTVQASARHLLSLINDLLDLAKIEADKLELLHDSVDCVAVLREVAETLRPQAEQKGLEFSVSLPAAALGLETDRRALTQIVINLADNAIKFTEAGTVRLALSRANAQSGKRIEILVEDTGPGIRAEDQGRLFEPFARFAGAGYRAKTGTGLGLHLSQKLATLMGGSIRCESAPGRGSRFILALPES